MRVEYNKKNNIKWTISSIFILPMIKLTRDNFLRNNEMELINVHIKNNQLVLIMKENHNFETLLISREEFSHKEIYNTEILYFYTIRPIYKIDFDKILEGKYSEISEDYKKELLEYYGKFTNDKEITYYDVLYPSDIKRRILADELEINDISVFKEVFKKPNIEIENFKYLNELFNGK